jgi:hypothetical protein
MINLTVVLMVLIDVDSVEVKVLSGANDWTIGRVALPEAVEFDPVDVVELAPVVPELFVVPAVPLEEVALELPVAPPEEVEFDPPTVPFIELLELGSEVFAPLPPAGLVPLRVEFPAVVVALVEPDGDPAPPLFGSIDPPDPPVPEVTLVSDPDVAPPPGALPPPP